MSKFKDDESGVFIAFSVFFFLIILMVAGIGVDLMRFEMTRTRLQYTLDSAVLAAADLDQEQDPTAVVNDYFTKAGMSSFLSNVVVDQGLNYRTVTADASSPIQTQFMHMMGVNTIDAPALAQAEERVAKVEISMVLDISGSMEDNGKIGRLRQAGKVFVDTVIKPETEDLISISLVPYSEHVNAGPNLYNNLLKFHKHNYSHCLEFSDSHFSTASLSTSTIYEQMQHFQWNYDGSNDRTNTICPRYTYERINPVSQNAGDLKDQINQLQPRAGTQIFIGMKWATALLDPSTRSVVTNLISQGHVDSDFAGRPAEYDDPETLKTIILMTDGKNSRTNRIRDQYYNHRDEYIHWNNYNLWWYLYRYVYSYRRSGFYQQKYNEAQGDYLLDNICDAAKNKGIVVWSIGFEVDNHGANVMENCASTPSHFFRVEGIELTEAFRAIARQINQLRLTQ